MNSKNPFTRLYQSMLYFHNGHRHELSSMEQQCKEAKTVKDMHRLASDIHSFCYYLHNHHTIEDHHLFPIISRKIDISHLKAQHAELAQLLEEFDNFSKHLKQLKTSTDQDLSCTIADATTLTKKVSTLVNEHEAAEENIIDPDNMQKWFTERDMEQLFHM